MSRHILDAHVIRNLNVIGANGNELKIWFGTNRDRESFALWLTDLQKDAQQTPAERYEMARQQMDSSNPSASE